jgi:hypothetical protein
VPPPTAPAPPGLGKVPPASNRATADCVGRDPVSDPDRPPLEVEPQLAQLPIKLLRVRLTQQRSLFNEQVDVERRVGELSGRQALQPLLPPAPARQHPGNSSDAIPQSVRRQQNLHRAEHRPGQRFAQCETAATQQQVTAWWAERCTTRTARRWWRVTRGRSSSLFPTVGELRRDARAVVVTQIDSTVVARL